MHDTVAQGISNWLPQAKASEKGGEQKEGPGEGEGRASRGTPGGTYIMLQCVPSTPFDLGLTSLAYHPATAYARRAGGPERGESRRGVRWRRTACVPFLYLNPSIHGKLTSGCENAAVELDPDGEEWTGIDPERDADAAERHEYEYSDEEQLATVTVVEDFDPSALLHGVAASEEQHERASPSPPHPPRPPPRGKAEGENERWSAASKGKKKGAAKKVRYETQAARRAARAKQHARMTEKAERAGGKASRNKAGGKRKQKVARG